jgi:hypothetical protein
VRAVSAGLVVGNASNITNAAGATIDLQGDGADIKPTGTGGTLTNAGTIKRSSGTGTATVGVPITSALDSIQPLVGVLSLAGGGSTAGIATIPNGGSLRFDSGTYAVTSASFVGFGTTAFGAVTLNLTGTTSVSTAATITASTVDGAGALVIKGATTWARGLMQGTGTVTVAPGATLTLPTTASGDRTLLRPFVNHGTVNIARGLSTGLILGNATTFTNAVDGSVFVQGDGADIKSNGTGGAIVNDGTFRRSSGASTTTVAVPFDSNGTLGVDTGTLTLTSFSAYDPSTKTLTKGTYEVSGILKLPGADIVHNNAAIRLSGAGSDIRNGTTGASALVNFVDNQGSLALDAAKALAVSTFDNTGTLAFDASSSLTVATTASLGGTLHLAFDNAPAPAVGQVFTIASYRAHTGCFSTIEGRDLTSSGAGLYDDIACGPTSVTATVKRTRLSINDATVTEGDSGAQMLTLTVSLNHARPDVAVTANWSTHAGTATSPADYVAATGTITWPTGDGTDKTIKVRVKGDTLDEVDETFTVDLANVSGAQPVDKSGVATIIDDDPKPPSGFEGQWVMMRSKVAATVVPRAALRVPTNVPVPLADSYWPVPPITPRVALNVASDESGAATVCPCIDVPSCEPSENVNVTKPENGPLPAL